MAITQTPCFLAVAWLSSLRSWYSIVTGGRRSHSRLRRLHYCYCRWSPNASLSVRIAATQIPVSHAVAAQVSNARCPPPPLPGTPPAYYKAPKRRLGKQSYLPAQPKSENRRHFCRKITRRRILFRRRRRAVSCLLLEYLSTHLNLGWFKDAAGDLSLTSPGMKETFVSLTFPIKSEKVENGGALQSFWVERSYRIYETSRFPLFRSQERSC
jgi:hypothetical protein